MQKQHKEILRTIVTYLRRRLAGTAADADIRGPGGERGDLDRELERLGVGIGGGLTPADGLADEGDRRAHQAAEARLAGVEGAAARRQMRAEIVERAAYTWINRLLALRSMEARGLIDETLRPNDAYDGSSEALFVLRQTQPRRTQGADGGWFGVIDDACAAHAAALPGLFDPADPNASLRPSAQALLDCLRGLAGRLPTTVYALAEVERAFADPDALGWAYQFYQAEAKDRVYAKLGSGGKVESRAEIAAATQLFTEPYMVKWLLQNSLGRSYAEAYPASELPATWEYYIRREQILAGDEGGAEGAARAGAEGDAEAGAGVRLAELTLLDPCMGSGHILREGFDMLFQMYAEQEPQLGAAEIAARVLSRHLYGIDIDPRAAQLAGLALVLRAWETVRAGAGGWGAEPPRAALNLATTPSLAPGALDRHLLRHPEDELYRPLLQGVFGALEQATLLGSLLRPEEHLDAAIAEFQKQQGRQLGLLGERAAGNRLLEELGRQDAGDLKRLLLERVRRSFAREAQESDVGSQLLGREAGEGMNLLRLLEGRYAVVCTNPPYMGSGNMVESLRQYIEKHYTPGKRDLYSAFILRCIQLCQPSGRTAMVTQQSWLFVKSYSELRALHGDALTKAKSKGKFTGLLREVVIEGVAHLGPNAFEEIGGEVVQTALFVCVKQRPEDNAQFVALRVTDFKSPSTKAQALIAQRNPYVIQHIRLFDLPGSPFGYWLSEKLFSVISSDHNVGTLAVSKAGLTTGESIRFYRKFWELVDLGEWLPLSNGGSYRKWFGRNSDYLRYGKGWVLVLSTLGNKLPSRDFYRHTGVVLSQSASGCLSCRIVSGQAFTNSSIAVFPQKSVSVFEIAGWMNSRCASYIVRIFAQKMGVEAKHLNSLPLVSDKQIHSLSAAAWVLKKLIIDRTELTEATYDLATNRDVWNEDSCVCYLLTIEALIDERTLALLGIADARQEIDEMTGTPAGCYPLIAGHDELPILSNIDNSQFQELDLAGKLRNHKRLDAYTERQVIKARLESLYRIGPGHNEDTIDSVDTEADDESAIVSSMPIPPETFLEELSSKLQVHPISVYWLLEELRGEGVRCKPEEKRLLEDRLSVLVLRLLGHRWPRQIEAGDPLPPWADTDGVIPLVPYTGEPTLEERVRQRLRADEGDLGAQRSEALLAELTGRSLGEWLARVFFRRHTSQFKKRPIAWHLASTPVAGARRRGSAQPAFECLLYYHRTPGDSLARLRTHYVEPLAARQRAAAAQADETAAALARARLQELEQFAARLRQVEEEGFACASLHDLLADEPLDRWSGDGLQPPASRAALLAQEAAWTVDINDGVRVNIAPLQAAGVLAAEVLNSRDLPKAVADRARWRSDERRWVRAGKLPRPGWLDEAIPASPQWTELAPQRAAERARLEERRRSLAAGGAGGAAGGAEEQAEAQGSA